jgi:hypothetical protein
MNMNTNNNNNKNTNLMQNNAYNSQQINPTTSTNSIDDLFKSKFIFKLL